MEENNELTAAIEKIVNKAVEKAIDRTLTFLRNNGGTRNFESWAEFENRYREWMKNPNNPQK